MVGPRAKKAAAVHLENTLSVSQRRAVRVLGLNRSTRRYKSVFKEDMVLTERLKELAAKHRRYGLPRLHYILKKEGLISGKSKLERIYKKLGLQLRNRRKKKMKSVTRVPLPKPTRPNECWSFDFVFDSTDFNKKLKCLTIVDDISKKSPGILVEYSIPSVKLIAFFESLPKLPKRLRCDNGPEMTSQEFMRWADRRGIVIEWIEPGKPIQNAFVESFNGKFRDECLNEEIFLDLEDAKKKIELWRVHYNNERPHLALKYKTPSEFEREFENKN